MSKNNTVTAIYEDIKYTYDPVFVGENIKRIREEKGITNKTFKELWFEDISSATLEKWNKGIDLPNIEDLDFMAACVLEVSLEYLLSGKEKEESSCWSYPSIEIEVKQYKDGYLIFEELSKDAKEYCLKNKVITPSDEYGLYQDGEIDFMSLSPKAKKEAYKHYVEPEDEVNDYLAGNRKLEDLSFWAKDLLYDLISEKEEQKQKAVNNSGILLDKDEDLENDALDIEYEDSLDSSENDDDEQEDNKKDPEQEVIDYLDGKKDYTDMSVEAQIYYEENYEDD